MEMRFKVFIIDEAHQLSSDAKDAFLKTLEEPPSNVVFVLATTEPQAIPITIRSRCQQFDFKRGSLQEIASRLRYVLECEGVSYTEAALSLIARGAEGSYRDSLSLLEQVLAFSPGRITPADVDAVLGTLDGEMLARVTEAVAHKDAPTAFALAGQLLDAGKEARTLLRTLSAHFRDLLLVTVGGPAVAQEMTQDEVKSLQAEQRACRFSPQMLLRAMETLNEAQGETRWNNQHRLLVELTFLKLMTHDGPPAAAGAAAFALPHVQFTAAPIVFPDSVPAAEPRIYTPLPSAPLPSAPLPPPVRAEVAAPASLRVPVATPPPPGADSAAKPVAVPVPAPVRTAVPASAAVGTSPPRGVASAPTARPPTAAPDTLQPSFFEDAPADADADDGLEVEDEYGPDDQTPSLFGDVPAVTRSGVAAGAISGIATAGGVPFAETPAGAPEVFVAAVRYDAADDDDTPLDGDDLSLIAVPDEDEDDEADDAEDVIGRAASLSVTFAGPEPHAASGTDEEAAEETNDDSTRLSLDQVMRAWPVFLQEAQRISKQTEVMMSQAAMPIDAQGKIVTLAFSARMNYDRMNEPKKLEFVRKLLARCLDVPSVTVRFVLDDHAPAAPVRPRGSGDRKAIKRDPVAALEEMTAGEAPTPVLDSTDAFGGGWGGGADAPRAATPVASRAASPVTAAVKPASAAPQGENPRDGDREPQRTSEGAGATAEGTRRWKSAMLENPLVQETLQVFGGEIIEE
jgi:DNA polymerase III delta subunit